MQTLVTLNVEVKRTFEKNVGRKTGGGNIELDFFKNLRLLILNRLQTVVCEEGRSTKC